MATGVHGVILILLSVLWLMVGMLIGYIIRGTSQIESLEMHTNILTDLLHEVLVGSHVEAHVRDTEAESPEAKVQARISHAAVQELADFIVQESGRSRSEAITEAEHMLGQFEAPAQDMPEMVKNERVNF